MALLKKLQNYNKKDQNCCCVSRVSRLSRQKLENEKEKKTATAIATQSMKIALLLLRLSMYEDNEREERASSINVNWLIRCAYKAQCASSAQTQSTPSTKSIKLYCDESNKDDTDRFDDS